MSRRKIERLAKKDGDNCMGCGRAYRNRDKSFVGHTADGKLTMMGECCSDRQIDCMAVSLYFAPNETWVDDDKEWFTAHPARSHRYRPAFPGEWPDPEATHTIIRQTSPGVRLRTGIGFNHLPGPPPPDATEEIAWAMWASVEEKKGTCTFAEILARATRLTTSKGSVQ